ATVTSAYGGIQLFHLPMTNTAYAFVSFWLHGGTAGGQQLQMYGNLGNPPSVQSGRYYLAAPIANTWQQYFVPLSALSVVNVTAGQILRTADARWFGMNVAIWDSGLDTTTSLMALTNMGIQAVRFPGG